MTCPRSIHATGCRAFRPWRPTWPWKIYWTHSKWCSIVSSTILGMCFYFAWIWIVFLQYSVMDKPFSSFEIVLTKQLLSKILLLTLSLFSCWQEIPPLRALLHFLNLVCVPLTLSVPKHDFEHWDQGDHESIVASTVFKIFVLAAVMRYVIWIFTCKSDSIIFYLLLYSTVQNSILISGN